VPGRNTRECGAAAKETRGAVISRFVSPSDRPPTGCARTAAAR